MLIFITGATGFIGSAVVPQLLAAGHEVLGLTRSQEGAERLRKIGADIHLGTLEDPDSLTRGAEKADAVIHLAFDHDFSNFQANCQKDATAIAALGQGLAGSDRPILITSGIGMGIAAPGQLAREDVLHLEHPNPRIASERAGLDLLDKGINLSTIRLSQIHDTKRQGLVSYLIDIARAKGNAAYVGDGATRWSACHLADTAQLFRLAIERSAPGMRYHAVAEEEIPLRAIAEGIGKGLGIPVTSLAEEQAADYFGPMSGFTRLDMPASSEKTRQILSWKPSGPGLLDDLAAMLNG
jgi:nucleoside-diphosphate-sugar epimerase